MLKELKYWGAAIALLFFSASLAISGDFEWTWKNPDAQTLSLKDKIVGVLVLSKDRSSRLMVEETLARQITERGPRGLSVHALLTESDLSDKEVTKTRLQEAKVAAVLIIKPTAKEGKLMDPAFLKNPENQSFWGYYGESWEEPSAADKNTKIHVQTKLFSLEQDMQVWSGDSITKGSEVVKFIDRLTPSIVKELQKSGLLPEK